MYGILSVDSSVCNILLGRATVELASEFLKNTMCHCPEFEVETSDEVISMQKSVIIFT